MSRGPREGRPRPRTIPRLFGTVRISGVRQLRGLLVSPGIGTPSRQIHRPACLRKVRVPSAATLRGTDLPLQLRSRAAVEDRRLAGRWIRLAATMRVVVPIGYDHAVVADVLGDVPLPVRTADTVLAPFITSDNGIHATTSDSLRSHSLGTPNLATARRPDPPDRRRRGRAARWDQPVNVLIRVVPMPSREFPPRQAPPPAV